MKKNKSEKIIFRAPKRAATLIIAATLNTAPTVGCRCIRLKHIIPVSDQGGMRHTSTALYF